MMVVQEIIKTHMSRKFFQAKIKEISDLTVRGEFHAAIDAINGIDDVIFEKHIDLAVSVFNPKFFSENAFGLVGALTTYPNLITLLEKAWFRKLAFIPEIVRAFNTVELMAENRDFQEIANTYSLILAAKMVSHFFGVFVQECQYREHVFELEGIYEKTFEPLFEQYRDEFFSNRESQIFFKSLGETRVASFEVITAFGVEVVEREEENIEMLLSLENQNHELRAARRSLEIQTFESQLKLELQEYMLSYLQNGLAKSNPEDGLKVSSDFPELLEVLERENELKLQDFIKKLDVAELGTEEKPSLNSLQDSLNISAVKIGLHLSALTMCNGAKGKFIALGNVGAGADYCGIQIYEMVQEIDPAIIESIHKNIPMPHEKYVELIKKSKGKLLVEIPILEQLRGYCGLRSSAELNEFSRLFFLILNNSDKSRDLDEVVAMTNKQHVQFVNFVREKIGFQFLEFLNHLNGKHKLVLEHEFFQDLAAESRRYRASDAFQGAIKSYMRENNIPDIFPEACYQNYLERDRYNFGDGTTITEEDKWYLQKVIPKQRDQLIRLFHRLPNDYDADDLLKLAALDEKITNCMLFGYKKACEMASSQEVPRELTSGCSPQKWIQSWGWEKWQEKYNQEHSEKVKNGYGPGALICRE